MTKDQIREIIKEKFILPRSLQLYKEFLGKTQIEVFKQEDDVIRKLMKGDSKASIIEDLKTRFPDGRFNYDDLDKFIERSDELHEILKIDNRTLAKRWFKARADLVEELADLAFYTKSMIPELKAEGDSSNALKAVTIMNTLLMNIGQVQGLLQPNQVNTQVNVVQDKAGEIRQRMREKAHHADFVIDVTNDKVSTKSEQIVENKGTDSEAI